MQTAGGFTLSGVTIVPPPLGPAAPTGLSATSGQGQLTISFTPGNDNGNPITNYKYSLDGINYTALSPADTTSPVTITGLTNGTTYTVYLKSVNSVGDSVASASTTGTPADPGDAYYTGVTTLLRLNNEFGNTTFRDSSVYKTHESLVSSSGVTNGTSFATFTGATGSGLRFDYGGKLLGAMFTSNDFTMEFWVRPSDSGTTRTLLNLSWTNDVTNGVQIQRNANSTITVNLGDTTGGWDVDILSNTTVAANVFSHIALTRVPASSTTSTYNLWLNGALVGTQTVNSFSLNFLNRLSVGCGFGNTPVSFAGAMYDVRLTAGVARYTAPFSISSSDPVFVNYGQIDPYYSNVQLLLHGDGNSNSGNIPDRSSYRRSPISSNGIAKGTTDVKIGKQKLAFTGYGATVRYTSSSDWNLGSSDFTIEAWVQHGGTVVNRYKTWFSRATGTNTNNWNTLTAGWAMSTNSSGVPEFGVKRSGSILTLTSPVSIDTGWHHLAAVRQGNTLRFYVDGVQRATGGLSSGEAIIDHTTGELNVGGGMSPGGDSQYKSMDEVRVTIGACRYPDGTTFTALPIPFYPNNDPYSD